MKGRVLLAVGAAGLAVGAGLAWNAVRSEREFRRLLAEGEQAVQMSRTLEAIESFSGALALRPDSMVAHLKRGDSYRLRGDYDAALRDLRDAAALDATAPRPLELLGDVNAAMERHDRAVEHYRAFLALDDRAPRVLYKLALSHYRARRAEQAIEPLRRALALDDQLHEAHYLLGLSVLETGQTDDAVASLRRAVALEPGFIAAREALADVYAAAGRRREQFEQLEAVAALESERPERLISIATAYAEAGRTNAALAAIDRLGDDPPEAAGLRLDVARTWLAAAAARSDRALAARARQMLVPLATQPDATGDALALLGRAQLLTGDAAAAERSLQLAVARLPVATMAFLDLADAAERRGHLPTARSALIDFTTLTGDEAARQRAMARIADLSLRLDEPSAAADWARRATSDRRTTPALYLTLARAELEMGHRDAARAAVRAGLLLSPRHRDLTRLSAQLR